jgi:predicted anti-sigma-YlaC factor YlaD
MKLLSFTVIFWGFIALSSSLRRHWVELLPSSKKFNNHPSQKQVIVLRIAGYSSLLIGYFLCLENLGISIGLVYWTGLITTAAALQSMLLTYRPQWIIKVGVILIIIVILIPLCIDLFMY